MVRLPIHLPEIELLARLACSKLPRTERALVSTLRFARFEAGDQSLCFSSTALKVIGPIAISQSHIKLHFLPRHTNVADLPLYRSLGTTLHMRVSCPRTSADSVL